MKYKTKIVPENGGYVGYAIQNDEVVFTTNVHRDSVMAIRELTNYISSAVPQKNAPVPIQKSNQTGIQAPQTDNLVPSKKPLSTQSNSVNTNSPAVDYAPAEARTFFNPPVQVQRRCCGRG